MKLRDPPTWNVSTKWQGRTTNKNPTKKRGQLKMEAGRFHLFLKMATFCFVT